MKHEDLHLLHRVSFTVFSAVCVSFFKPSYKHPFQKHLVTAPHLEVFAPYLWSSSIPSKTAVFTCQNRSCSSIVWSQIIF